MIDGLSHPRLLRFAASLVGAQDAEDVVQDVYLKILSGQVAPYAGYATIETWAMAVVKYTAFAWRKDRQHRERQFLDVNCIDVRTGGSFVTRLDSDSWADESLTHTPDYDTVLDTKRAIAALSPIHQSAVRTYEVHGSYASTAAALGLTRGQVRGRLYRARRRLRARLA